MRTSKGYYWGVCYASLLFILPASVCGQARKDSAAIKKHIEEVVVTGQYSPNNPEKTVQKIKIIGREKIQMMNAQNLKDVLSNELNIRLTNDNILGTSMSVGGVSGRNVKILIDGVPVIGRVDGVIDLSQINLNNIERIEIIEGPMSVNYGTDALGGAVNLITKKTLKKELEGNVAAYYETIGTYNLTGRLGYQKKNHTVTLNAGRNFFDGWNNGEKISFDYGPEVADSSRYFQSKPREQYFSTLQYIYRIGNTTLNYKGDLFKETITNRGKPDTLYGENATDDYYRTRRIDNSVFVNTRMGKGLINVQASYNDYKRTKNTFAKNLITLNESLSANLGDQDTSKFNQFNTRGTYSNKIKSGMISYEAGFDINLQNGTGRRIKNSKQLIGDYAAYASVEYRPWDNVIIRPGIRYSYNTSYKAPLIPSINLSYKMTGHLTLRGSYGKGFRAPDLKELYFYFYDINHDIKGNENLRAEYSDNYNASLVYTNIVGKMLYKIDVSGFYNDILDMITLAYIGPTGREYTYVNVGRFKSQGVQANADFTVDNIKLSVGGSYIGRYNELSQVDNTVTPFSFSPEARGSISYTFTKHNLTAALFYKYTGKLPGFGTNDTGKIVSTFINEYQMADLNISKQFLKGKLLVGAGCKNLFNISSVRSFMVSQGAHSQGTGAIMGNGRLYFLKLDYNF